MEYYSALKKEENSDTHGNMQNLEGIMLIEINQLQYAKYCMIPDEVLKVIKVLR